ncbi:MAG: hypothetical protein LUG23_00780 [Oscillospiraceae bacterium]|nr:hypothetical protein [Oscillospiraceae bacterium]
MRNTMLIYIDRFRHDRHSRRVLGSVLLVLAIVVSLAVYWQLRLHGIAITNETYCGYEEHVHTDDCYEYTLICELEESEGYAHTDECYEEQQVLVCGLEETLTMNLATRRNLFLFAGLKNQRDTLTLTNVMRKLSFVS